MTGGAGVAVPLIAVGVGHAISATGCTRLGSRHQLRFASSSDHNLRSLVTKSHPPVGGSFNSRFREAGFSVTCELFEAWVAVKRLEGGIDPKPPRRQIVGPPEQLLQQVERLVR